MLFAIDIDGTIATHTEERLVYLPYFNRALGLGLSEQELSSFSDFFAFREQVILPWMDSPEKQRAYQEAATQLQYDADRQQAAIPLPGAIAGVRLLAQYGKIIYVTYRKPDTEELTRRWLASYGFPSPERAYCSEYSYDKPRYALQDAHEEDQVVLIDNDMARTIIGFRTFCTQHRDLGTRLLKRLGLIVYGHQELDPVKTPKIAPVLKHLPLKRLVDWQQISSFLQGDFHELAYAIARRQSQQ